MYTEQLSCIVFCLFVHVQMYLVHSNTCSTSHNMWWKYSETCL